MSEKSGQLIECVNPDHRMLGSIHYKQDSCVGVTAKSLIEQFCLAVEVAMKHRETLGETYGEIAAKRLGRM